MDITIKEYTPVEMEPLLALYASVGWVNYTRNPAMLANAVRHSLTLLGAFDGDRLVGILRAVGDGFSVVYIQDIIVLPEYQRNGIGRRLLHAVDALYPHVYQKVLLTDRQPHTLQFYESCGYAPSTQRDCVAFVKFSS